MFYFTWKFINISICYLNIIVLVKRGDSPVSEYGSMYPCTNPPMLIKRQGNRNAWPGSITSPHWPYFYMNNLDCQWNIRAQIKKAVKLTIEKMWTEPE